MLATAKTYNGWKNKLTYYKRFFASLSMVVLCSQQRAKFSMYFKPKIHYNLTLRQQCDNMSKSSILQSAAFIEIKKLNFRKWYNANFF